MRLLLFLVLLLTAGCTLNVFDTSPKKLSYKIFIEPEFNRIRVSGQIESLKEGAYFFALPRTQGFPVTHFVKYLSFSDAGGDLDYQMTDLGEWKVSTTGPTLAFMYHINLQ